MDILPIKEKINRGFSLVEAIVAIAIMSLAIVAPITAAQRSLVSARYSRDEMTAYFLAEEALDYIHYIRDTNAVPDSNGKFSDWLSGLGNCDATKDATQSCGIDPTAGGGNNIIKCQPSDKCDLRFNSGTGIYGYQNSSVQTAFNRSVQILPASNSNERKVTATVKWKNAYSLSKTVVLTDYITNWKEQVSQASLSLNQSSSGLIGWWKFDELSGTTAADSSGNNNNATVSGAAWTTNGKINGALSFNSTSDRAQLSSDIIGTGPVTVCAWFNSNSARYGAALMSNYRFTISVYTYNRIGVTSDGINSPLSPVNTIVPGTWQHICATRDASGFSNTYINGALVSSGGTGTPSAGNALTIGNHPWLSWGWDGLLDDVRVYNRILSLAEVQNIYNGQ